MKRDSWLVLGAFLTFLILLSAAALAQEAGAASQQGQSVSKTIGLGAAAAFVAAVSILGAGYAVARVGSAALGVIAEKPELLPRTILFVALAEGLAVLGFAVAMILIQKI